MCERDEDFFGGQKIENRNGTSRLARQNPSDWDPGTKKDSAGTRILV
jgi:hypothetical protein